MDLSLCIGTIFSSFRPEMEEQGPDKSQPLARSGDVSQGQSSSRCSSRAKQAILFADREAEATQHPALAASHASSQKWREKRRAFLNTGPAASPPLWKLDLAHARLPNPRVPCRWGAIHQPCTALPMPSNKAFSRAAP
ncbi:hypothetical protein L1887_50619 [Cichorium endivia]|nr:hypothetical protein L1887_50619 [Cichorium endivia]